MTPDARLGKCAMPAPIPCTGVQIPGKYATLAEAIQKEKSGTLCVHRGTYDLSQFDIDIHLRIVGVDPGEVIIRSPLEIQAAYRYKDIRFEHLIFDKKVRLITTGNAGYCEDHIEFDGVAFSRGLELEGTQDNCKSFVTASNSYFISNAIRMLDGFVGAATVESSTFGPGEVGVLVAGYSALIEIRNTIVSGYTTAVIEQYQAGRYTNDLFYNNKANWGPLGQPDISRLSSLPAVNPEFEPGYPPSPSHWEAVSHRSSNSPGSDFWGRPRRQGEVGCVARAD